MAQYCFKYQPCKYYRGNYSNRNCTAPKKPQTRRNLSNYPVKPDTINEVKEIDEYGFNINEINRTVEYSFVIAQSLPGIPMDKLQEDIIIDYIKQLSCKDTPAIPEKVEYLEIIDMLFYYSPYSTEDFNSKKDSIEAIFTIPVYKEGLFASPFGSEVVIEFPDNIFIKGIQ
jgi:hypothetical protein